MPTVSAPILVITILTLTSMMFTIGGKKCLRVHFFVIVNEYSEERWINRD
jgi:hypothetical protein